MKKVLFFMTLVLASLIAKAGPEDHYQNQSCFELVGHSDTISKTVPTEVCLEDIRLDLSENKINIYSYFQSELFKNLTLINLQQHKENRYDFSAQSLILENYDSGCGEGEKVTLLIEGQADGYGISSAERINVSVEREYLHDVCHSFPQVETYRYQLR